MSIKETAKYSYIPPDSNVTTEDISILAEKAVPDVVDPKKKEYEELKGIADKNELVTELCKYLEGLVDQELGETSFEYDPEWFPDVYRAMVRRFPEADPHVVTYQQYKEAINFIIKLMELGVY